MGDLLTLRTRLPRPVKRVGPFGLQTPDTAPMSGWFYAVSTDSTCEADAVGFVARDLDDWREGHLVFRSEDDSGFRVGEGELLGWTPNEQVARDAYRRAVAEGAL